MLMNQHSIDQAMPIFDYQCTACGHRFDALQKASESALTQCPACGEQTLKKLLSAPNFQLKGAGWRRPKAEQPVAKTRRGHMFDSPVPHAEHHDHATSHDHGHDHGHAHPHPHDHSHDH
jgi:putative FmdB family regulatory protein